jgi:hypothetical protein
VPEVSGLLDGGTERVIAQRGIVKGLATGGVRG